MTVREFSEHFGYRVYCMPDGDREINGGYAGDLLSWVMGKLNANDAWVTIMSNANIVAVSALTDPACVILSENVKPDDGVIEKAMNNGLNLLGAEQDTFAVCNAIASVL